jgi:hypothetical protein
VAVSSKVVTPRAAANTEAVCKVVWVCPEKGCWWVGLTGAAGGGGSSEKGWFGIVESKCKLLLLREGSLPSLLQGLQ